MAQAVDQAQHERQLSKERLAESINRAEARVRHELDWKTRLRRNGVRYAIVGGVAVLVVTSVVLLRLRYGRKAPQPEPIHAATLDDIARELTGLRDELSRLRKHQAKDQSPLWQKASLRAVAAAGSAAGQTAARQMMEHYGDAAAERDHAS